MERELRDLRETLTETGIHLEQACPRTTGAAAPEERTVGNSELRHRIAIAEAQLEAGERIATIEAELDGARPKFGSLFERALAGLRADVARQAEETTSPAAVETLRRSHREVESLLIRRAKETESDLLETLRRHREDLGAQRAHLRELLESPAGRSEGGVEAAVREGRSRITEVEHDAYRAMAEAESALDADYRSAATAIAESVTGGARRELRHADETLVSQRRKLGLAFGGVIGEDEG